MAVCNQPGQGFDKAIDGTAMPDVLNLRNVLELIDYTFTIGSLAQQQLVHQRHQSIFYVTLDFRDQLQTDGVQQLLK